MRASFICIISSGTRQHHLFITANAGVVSKSLSRYSSFVITSLFLLLRLAYLQPQLPAFRSRRDPTPSRSSDICIRSTYPLATSMPPKRSTTTKVKTVTQVNGVKSKSETKAKPKPTKAPAKTSTKSTKIVTGRKRKSDEEEDLESVNGVTNKKQKGTRAASSSVEPAKRPAGKTVAKAPAAKKPRTVKHREILNQPPTQRLNVYVFGDGSSGGELGLGSGKGQKEVRRPRLNPHLSADTAGVVQVACGGMHSACLTHDNKILTWGVNDQGALGRDTTWEGGLRDVTEDEGSDADSDDDDGELNPHESTPGPVDFSDYDEVPTFTQLACTDSATFALTAEGDVYGWGTFRVSCPFCAIL